MSDTQGFIAFHFHWARLGCQISLPYVLCHLWFVVYQKVLQKDIGGGQNRLHLTFMHHFRRDNKLFQHWINQLAQRRWRRLALMSLMYSFRFVAMMITPLTYLVRLLSSLVHNNVISGRAIPFAIQVRLHNTHLSGNERKCIHI